LGNGASKQTSRTTLKRAARIAAMRDRIIKAGGNETPYRLH